MIDELTKARMLKMWSNGSDTMKIAEEFAYRFSSLTKAEAYIYNLLARDKETNMKRRVL